MMNHECEAEEPKDEGIAVVTIGKGEPIPEDWPEGLKRIIKAIRSDAEDDEELIRRAFFETYADDIRGETRRV